MRNAIVLLVTLGLLPVCLARPFLGITAVTVYAYLRPQDLAWGVSGYRLTLLMTVATVVGVLFARGERMVHWGQVTALMVLLWFLVALSYLFAQSPALALPAIIDFTKVIGLALLTSGLVTTLARCRTILWAIVGALGFLAVKGTVWSLARGGEIIGGPGGMIGDNNSLATAFVMMLPLAFALARTEEQRMLRRGAQAIVVFAFAAIVFTFSRGGFLGLIAVIGVMWIGAERKFRGALLLMGVAVCALVIVPESYYERISTIADTESYDRSIQGRFQAWDVAIQAVAEHPLTGVGYNNFLLVFPRYSPHSPRVTHNSYLQIASECGLPALAVYLGLFATGIAALRRLRREAAGAPQATDIVVYSKALEASLCGYMVCATFLSFAQFDLYYQEIALIACLCRLPLGDSAATAATDSTPEPVWGRRLGAGIPKKW